VNATSNSLQNQVDHGQRFIFKRPKPKPIKTTLLRFFTAWNPPIVKNIDALVNKYQDNPTTLLNSIKKIYNVKHFDGKPTKLQFNLIQFYMKHERKNLKNVPLILKSYKGKERLLKSKLENYYKGSTLILPSVKTTKKASSSGNVLKNLLNDAKKNKQTPTNLHYEDPKKVLEREKKKCCTLEWKSCKACQLKISVEMFCENNVGRYGCMKTNAAIAEETTKYHDKQKEERRKHLEQMDRQVEESKKNIKRQKEEKTKRAKRHTQLMQSHREQSEKEQRNGSLRNNSEKKQQRKKKNEMKKMRKGLMNKLQKAEKLSLNHLGNMWNIKKSK